VPERTYRITATPEVGSDYMAIVQHIERWTGDRATAVRTVRAIRAFVRSLETLPHRGLKRDDLRPGLRLIPFGRRTVIAFEIETRGAAPSGCCGSSTEGRTTRRS